MLKETRIIQVYPDQNAIQHQVETMSRFGWELVSNRLCEEYDDNGDRCGTFNKLIFERDKESSRYLDYLLYENEYNALQDQQTAWQMLGEKYMRGYVKDVLENCPHPYRFNFFTFLFSTVLGVIPGILYCCHIIGRNRIYKRFIEKVTPQKDELENIQKRIREIEIEASTLKHSVQTKQDVQAFLAANNIKIN